MSGLSLPVSRTVELPPTTTFGGLIRATKVYYKTISPVRRSMAVFVWLFSQPTASRRPALCAVQAAPYDGVAGTSHR